MRYITTFDNTHIKQVLKKKLYNDEKTGSRFKDFILCGIGYRATLSVYAMDGKEVVGWAYAQHLVRNDWDCGCYILPEYRGKGCGSEVLKRLAIYLEKDLHKKYKNADFQLRMYAGERSVKVLRRLKRRKLRVYEIEHMGFSRL